MDSLVIKVDEELTPPRQIFGPRVFCLNEPVQYSVGNLQPDEFVRWQVFDGDTITPSFMDESKGLYYLWTSAGPYRIKAQIINALTACESNITTFDFLTNITITGQDSVCQSSTHRYYLSSYNDKNITWEISPPGAGTVYNANNNSCRISWRWSGTHKLSTQICGQEIVKYVTVSRQPNPYHKI